MVYEQRATVGAAVAGDFARVEGTTVSGIAATGVGVSTQRGELYGVPLAVTV